MKKKFRFQKGAFLLLCIYGGLFFILSIRLFYIQVTGEANGQALKALADSKYARQSVLSANRGEIVDRNGDIIASDTLSYRLVGVLDEELSDKKVTRHVDDPEKTAAFLSEYIDVDEAELVKRLTRTDEDRQEKRKKQVEFGKAGNALNHELVMEMQEASEEQNINGLLFLEENKRFYPNGVFAPYLIGFAQRDYDENGKMFTAGKMGLELTYDKELSGEDGKVDFQADRWGFMLPKSEKAVIPPKDGMNLKLTIDKAIQNFVEDAMNIVEKENKPAKMFAVVADPKTGEILAMSQRPAFNPTTREGLTESWLNEALETTIEPGSTMKIFTLASAIEEGKWDPDAYFKSGQYTIFDRTIRDHNRDGWGYISYLEGFERSSNVSMAYLLEKVGDRKFIDYLKGFGFGEKTGIDLPKEAAGIILDNYPSERLTTSYGQGSTITPIQMIQGASAIANDGKMMKPYVIQEMNDPNTGKVVKKHKPEAKKSPISSDTAKRVREVLASTVTSESGTGQRFALDQYQVGGKTGTAEIPDSNGGYKSGHGQYLYSFVGMAPIDDPQLLVYVGVQEPELKDGEIGSDPVAKIFNPVMENGLKSLNIAPTIENAVEAHKVDDFTGKDVEEVEPLLTEASLKPVVIGEGGKIQQQYPKAGTKTSKGSAVLLQTEGDVTLPDFTGWSKKMVFAYTTMTGINIEMSGNGYVTKQNKAAGELVTRDDVIKLTFKEPAETYEPKPKKKQSKDKNRTNE